MSKKKSYPVRIPRFAAGIRAQESRTGLGRIWWAKEWMRRIEAMMPDGRLGRARNYAASGQVTELSIAGNCVQAKVVGTREAPYDVTLVFTSADAAAKKRILAAFQREPMLTARILADDLPTEVEELFRAEGLDFFPGGKLAPGKYDVTISCTCPDYANPCKHALAVLLLLGEEIARRPATLLELRGILLEDLCHED